MMMYIDKTRLIDINKDDVYKIIMKGINEISMMVINEIINMVINIYCKIILHPRIAIVIFSIVVKVLVFLFSVDLYFFFYNFIDLYMQLELELNGMLYMDNWEGDLSGWGNYDMDGGWSGQSGPSGGGQPGPSGSGGGGGQPGAPGGGPGNNSNVYAGGAHNTQGRQDQDEPTNNATPIYVNYYIPSLRAFMPIDVAHNGRIGILNGTWTEQPWAREMYRKLLEQQNYDRLMGSHRTLIAAGIHPSRLSEVDVKRLLFMFRYLSGTRALRAPNSPEFRYFLYYRP